MGEDEKTLIREEYRQTGKTLRELAEGFKRSITTIHRICRDVPREKVNISLNKDRNALMAELYQSGYNLREVGRLTGVSRETVRKELKRLNVKTRKRGKSPEGVSSVLKCDDISLIIEMYEGGSTQKEIARHFNIHQTTIKRVLEGQEIKTRNKGRLPIWERFRLMNRQNNEDE